MFLSTTSHDELGHPVTLHLDAFGRAVHKTEPLDTSTTITTDYAYDRLGRLTGITDDAGNDWAYSFDSFGRTLTVNDPDLGLWTKSYDDAGQLLTQTDALAQVTRFNYDLLGRMLTKTARDGTPQAELTSYTYDQAVAGFHIVGALTRAENPTGTLNYRYDQMGRETQRVYTLDGTDYTITSGFDIAGRLLWQDYPDGDAVGSALDPITYDAAGRLVAIPGLVTAATYDAAGNAETFTRANGVVSTYGTSDQRGWLDSLTTLSGATSIQALTYTRDATGQITAVASTHADESWTYGYDALRRLLSATNTNTPAYNRTYTYDSIGNMLTNSGVVGSYSYPLPASPRPHAVTGIGGWTYSYDANGNMTAGAGRTFTYNGDNRPTQIDTQTYSYGPDGERWKTVDTAPSGGTTLYLGGTIEIAAGLMTKYLPGNATRVGSPGDPLVETFWLHHDHQGSIQAITDATGAEVQRFQYYPYGDRIATASAHDESKGWIGERQDATGLFYLHARYYDPVIGRFASADPSDPMAPGVGMNRYAYAGNNPVMRVDPWGLKYVGNDESGGGTKSEYQRRTSHGSKTPNEYRRNQRRPSISAPMRAQGYVYDNQTGEYVLPAMTPHAAVETAAAWAGFGFDWAAIEAIFGGGVAIISAPVIGGLVFTGAMLYPSSLDDGTLAGPAAGTVAGTQTEILRQHIFFHGTDLASALDLLNGGLLNADVAAAQLHSGGELGFYLATDLEAAGYFARRAGPNPGVIANSVSGTGLDTLIASGAQLRPIAPGGIQQSGQIPGQELFVPTNAFPTFNGLMGTHDIIPMPVPRN